MVHKIPVSALRIYNHTYRHLAHREVFAFVLLIRKHLIRIEDEVSQFMDLRYADYSILDK